MAGTDSPQNDRLRSVYNKSAGIEEAVLEDIHQRFDGLAISDEQKKLLIPWAQEFYLNHRQGEPSPLRIGVLISLYALDPSREAKEKYFDELVKFDPASPEGKLVVDHFASYTGDALSLIMMQLSLNDQLKGMYDAVKADSDRHYTPPPPRNNR